jgi:hypothetical protein
MSFDFNKTGLAQKAEWVISVKACHAWLTEHMSMFGQKGIENFMLGQPVKAAQTLLAACDDISDAAITAVLLGPARSDILRDYAVTKNFFAPESLLLIKAREEGDFSNAGLNRDLVRVMLAEGVSSMNDQLIGRAKIDRHHPVRWRMLDDFERFYADVAGQNPKLDVVFADCLAKSRAALEALGPRPVDAQPNPARPPKP